MAVTVTTSTFPEAWAVLSSPGSRVIVKSPLTGRLWTMVTTPGYTGRLYWSTDGAAWTDSGLTTSNWWHGNLRFDESGNLHGVTRTTTDGSLRFQRWAAVGVTLAQNVDMLVSGLLVSTYPAITVHADGAGWVAHLLASSFNGAVDTLTHVQVRLDGAGLVVGSPTQQTIRSAAAVSNHRVALDFHHTGDGHTIKAGAPHLFAAWTLSGGDLGVAKATYSGGAWTWGAPVQLSPNGSTIPVSALFDGSRFIVAARDGVDADTLLVFERDAAWTLTTARPPTDIATDAQTIHGVAVSVDKFGDFYLAAAVSTTATPATNRIQAIKYTRDTNSYGTWATVEDVRPRINTGDTQLDMSMMAFADTRVRLVYVQHGTGAQPWTVRYESPMSTNVAPDPPAWLLEDNQPRDVAAALTLLHGFTDRNTGDTQRRRAIKRQIGATVRWWNGTAFAATGETWIVTNANFLTLAAGWGLDADANHMYAVNVEDQDGLASGYGPWLTVIPTAKDNPTLTGGALITTPSRTTTWTVATQTRRRVWYTDDLTGEIFDDTGFSPATGTSGSYTSPVVMPNGTEITERIQTINDEGLPSDVVALTFNVSYTPPWAPTFELVEDTPKAANTLLIANPPASGGRPELAYNNVYRRTLARDDDGNVIFIGPTIRRGTQIPADSTWVDDLVPFTVEVEYRAEAVAVTGAVSLSAWGGGLGDSGPDPDPGGSSDTSVYGEGIYGEMVYGA